MMNLFLILKVVGDITSMNTMKNHPTAEGEIKIILSKIMKGQDIMKKEMEMVRKIMICKKMKIIEFSTISSKKYDKNNEKLYLIVINQVN